KILRWGRPHIDLREFKHSASICIQFGMSVQDHTSAQWLPGLRVQYLNPDYAWTPPQWIRDRVKWVRIHIVDGRFRILSWRFFVFPRMIVIGTNEEIFNRVDAPENCHFRACKLFTVCDKSSISLGMACW